MLTVPTNKLSVFFFTVVLSVIAKTVAVAQIQIQKRASFYDFWLGLLGINSTSVARGPTSLNLPGCVHAQHNGRVHYIVSGIGFARHFRVAASKYAFLHVESAKSNSSKCCGKL